MAEPLIIAVDDNGEFQLPDEVMARHAWGPGSRLALEVIPGGLLIKSALIEAHDSEPET
ncbi:hypothetical protein [Novosphingobium olei]|uniref:AbrB/MazE/SpoVT family DNA-binding domain-containing protein n=1 Tax=Novosphingobium olei TaxID=2728851 RepID=A0A7Y0BTS4_9SPHN|nr:hypothetical protein [Novosphingobium olei]NML96318.1 hypothetical protein [Novosphingobium olei]